MSDRLPLASLEATLTSFGPAGCAIPVPLAYGPVELEYAAIRKGAALLDEPHQGLVEVHGGDRLDFLDRMLTQQLADLAPGALRESFWLSRTGRVVADLLVAQLPERTLLLADAFACPALVESLGTYLFTEDVELLEATRRWRRLSLHGPRALETLRGAGLDAQAIAALEAERAVVATTLDGAPLLALRFDLTGETGVGLAVEAQRARGVWERLQDAGATPSGWGAVNIARIEAGEPLFHVDFGEDALPHETALHKRRVSFTKGCYLGQEIVARMESRGQAARRLVALQLERDPPAPDDPPRQPLTGDAVRIEGEAAPVGAVTSSVVSPMLGDVPVCFAMLKAKAVKPGAAVLVDAPGGNPLRGVVQESLRFWP